MSELTIPQRKKLIHALRSMLIRYRRHKKDDKEAIASFCYEKGLPRSEVEGMYQIIIDAKRLPIEEA